MHQHNLNNLTPRGDKNSSQDQYVKDLRNLGIESVQESTATTYINWQQINDLAQKREEL